MSFAGQQLDGKGFEVARSVAAVVEMA